MSLTQTDIDKLVLEWDELEREGVAYFDRVRSAIKKSTNPSAGNTYGGSNKLIPDHDRDVTVPEMSNRLTKLVFRIMGIAKSSPLVGELELGDLKTALKEILASFRFQSYVHWETHVLNDEDRVLGVEPAGHREDGATFSDALEEFHEAANKVRQVLRLIFPSDTPVATAIAQSEISTVKKYRPNTAFIMMWISKDHPELEDVKNCFKQVFKRFGIEAVRSDEIEHSDKITDRILHEIATSEFLIADLTGERTSVYYEIGYAHALGKRPILFRKANTHLGFDLAGHHCPEYENITDLRRKLEARLEALTNRTARG